MEHKKLSIYLSWDGLAQQSQAIFRPNHDEYTSVIVQRIRAAAGAHDMRCYVPTRLANSPTGRPAEYQAELMAADIFVGIRDTRNAGPSALSLDWEDWRHIGSEPALVFSMPESYLFPGSVPVSDSPDPAIFYNSLVYGMAALRRWSEKLSPPLRRPACGFAFLVTGLLQLENVRRQNQEAARCTPR